MLNRQIIGTGLAAIAAGALFVAPLATPRAFADPGKDEVKKVVVCKYVNKPHAGEYAHHIINPAVNAVEGWNKGEIPPIGATFSDGQDGSIVIAYGDAKGYTLADCPTWPDESPSPSPTDTPTTPGETPTTPGETPTTPGETPTTPGETPTTPGETPTTPGETPTTPGETPTTPGETPTTPGETPTTPGETPTTPGQTPTTPGQTPTTPATPPTTKATTPPATPAGTQPGVSETGGASSNDALIPIGIVGGATLLAGGIAAARRKK